jgi:hypothetical protein
MKITRKRFFKILESDKKQTKKEFLQFQKNNKHLLSYKRKLQKFKNSNKETLKNMLSIDKI